MPSSATDICKYELCLPIHDERLEPNAVLCGRDKAGKFTLASSLKITFILIYFSFPDV